LQDLGPAKSGLSYAFLGYACDEGVRRNQGRTGAAEGPDTLRPFLGRLPIHFDESVALFDLGNMTCPNGRLEEAQEELAKAVCRLLQWRYRPILLGGGHDMAFGHYSGIRRFLDQEHPDKKLGILNLDAHFDLREPKNGPHSGTPFFQMAQKEGSSGHSFHYLVAGIRQSGNTKILFDTADRLGVHFATRESILRNPDAFLLETLPSFLESIDFLYLSIDLDAFSSAFAPGVSAPYPLGLNPDFARQVIQVVKRSGKLTSTDVAEFNPEFDLDGRTAQLAADFIYGCLTG
jgi:formiminoglutamase